MDDQNSQEVHLCLYLSTRTFHVISNFVTCILSLFQLKTYVRDIVDTTICIHISTQNVVEDIEGDSLLNI